MNSQNDKLPNGLTAQLVEHCIGIAEVRVRITFKPVFFRISFRFCTRAPVIQLVEHRAAMQDVTGSNIPAGPTLRVFK